jgi:hypothetical protein
MLITSTVYFVIGITIHYSLRHWYLKLQDVEYKISLLKRQGISNTNGLMSIEKRNGWECVIKRRLTVLSDVLLSQKSFLLHFKLNIPLGKSRTEYT